MPPKREHNMFAIKLIGLAISIVTAIIGIISVDWGSVARFGHSITFLYERVDEIDHLLSDFHEILSLQSEVDYTHKKIDSLIYVNDSLSHSLELVNAGKYPYDSIYRVGPSGYGFVTTVEKHFNEEHEN